MARMSEFCVHGTERVRCKTEYRCRNGLCIPRRFLLDRSFDCPDRYDEPQPTSALTVKVHNLVCQEEHPQHAKNTAWVSTFSLAAMVNMFLFVSMVLPNCSNFRHAFMLKALFRPYYNLNDDTDVCHRLMFCLFEITCLFEHCPNGYQQHCGQL